MMSPLLVVAAFTAAMLSKASVERPSPPAAFRVVHEIPHVPDPVGYTVTVTVPVAVLAPSDSV